MRLLLVLCCLLASSAFAQAPAKPIRLVIAYPPGGAAEGTWRAIQSRFEATVGQTFVMENRPGAGATIGAEYVSKQPPDGTTLHLADNGPLAIVPGGRRLGYDPLKSFSYIGIINIGGTVLAAHPSVAAANLEELVRLARAKPGSFSFGTSGFGGIGHMSGELFKSVAKIDIVHVPYKGGGPAVADLLGGQVPLLFSSLTPAVPHIKTGKFKAFAVTSARRSSALPDVPTIAEQGYPGFEASTYFMLLGPAGLPAEIVGRLSEALRTTLADRQTVENLQKQGYEPDFTTPEETLARIRRDLAKWTKVITDVGIKLE